MQQQTRYLIYDGKAGPVSRFLMAVAGIALAAVSLVLGFVFFLAFLGVGLVIALVMWFRLRSFRRQVAETDAARSHGERTVIDGDFTVVRPPEPPSRNRP